MIRINQIKTEPGKEEILEKIITDILGVGREKIIKWTIARRSVDARKKEKIVYVYSVDVLTEDEEQIIKRIKNPDISIIEEKPYFFKRKVSCEKKPVIVGAGPAGLFCALILAENGLKPLIIERGKKVSERVKDTEAFWKSGILDEDSNVQFGEGGAGTFSDGKLNSGIKDKKNRIRKVLEELCISGAPEEIKYDSKPHIGTDNLRKVVVNMRKRITEYGGEFLFSEKVKDIKIVEGKISAVITDKKTYDCERLILAVGHSARDTFEMLSHYLVMKPKPFSVGVRIEHKKDMIDRSQYGDSKYADILPAADYKLVHHNKERSIYTFCMCPGGVVLGASSGKNEVVTNGMSYYSRNLENSNSAVLVTVTPEDFGDENPLAGIIFQQNFEKKAFTAAGSNYSAPVQLFGDLKKGKESRSAGEIIPSYKPGYEFSDLRYIFPGYIVENLIVGIENFGRIIKGFDSYDAVLTGVETRSSSPVRILRDEKMETSIRGIYAAGEGAGYAGGIVSSAVDGIKTAEKVIESYLQEGWK